MGLLSLFRFEFNFHSNQLRDFLSLKKRIPFSNAIDLWKNKVWLTVVLLEDKDLSTGNYLARDPCHSSDWFSWNNIYYLHKNNYYSSFSMGQMSNFTCAEPNIIFRHHCHREPMRLFASCICMSVPNAS